MSSQDRHLLSGRPSPGQLTDVPARYGPRHARDMGAGAGTADNWKPALRVRPGRHASPAEPLTGRETEVLGLLRGSLSTRGIAAELSLSPNTIKTHIRCIYRKLGVCTRAAAITRARDIGLLRPGGGEQQRHEAYSGQGSWAALASA